VTPLFRS